MLPCLVSLSLTTSFSHSFQALARDPPCAIMTVFLVKLSQAHRKRRGEMVTSISVARKSGTKSPKYMSRYGWEAAGMFTESYCLFDLEDSTLQMLANGGEVGKKGQDGGKRQERGWLVAVFCKGSVISSQRVCPFPTWLFPGASVVISW